MRRAIVVVVLVVLAVVGLAGCGGDGDDEDTAGSTTTTAGAGSTSEPEDTTTSVAGETTTSTSDTGGSASSSSVPEDDLPGEPIDIYPYEGAALSVVGVAANDTLNVRSGPGTDFEVVTELGPLAADSTATGSNRTLDDDSLWVELEAGGTTGWANGLYVAEAGQTTDVTAELPAVSAETMAAVGEAVAAARAPAGEGPTPSVTIVDGPTVADVGEVTVDVVGLADDALKGERLHVVASAEDSGEGFTVTAVEATALCARGVTAEGLCT